jgi:hypothetical protein
MVGRSRAPELPELGVWAAWAAPLLAVLLASGAASADPQAIRLVWVRGERTESCDDGAGIARRVVARLGRDVFREGASRSIEGVVQHQGDRWDAHLYLREAGGALAGSRDLTSDAPDCEPLEAAVTLAIALAIDPDAALRPLSSPEAPPPPPAAPAPAPSPPPAPALAPPPPPADSTAARPPSRPNGAVRVSPPTEALPAPPPRAAHDGVRVTGRAVVAAGVLPATSFGFAWSAEAPADRVFVGTAGVLYLPEVRTPARDFAFGLTTAWLGACAQGWGARPVSLAVCGKVLLGAIHAVVYALEPTQPGDRLWAGASLAGQARFRIVGPLVAELGAEMVVPLTRPRFRVSGESAPVFQEAPVGVAGFAGIGVSIP